MSSGATYSAAPADHHGDVVSDPARSAGLDLHKGIPSRGCSRWPRNLFLQSTLGDLVPGRCKSTNLCDYCAKLAAVENAEVLAQDAMTNGPPALWSVLTTRSTIASMAVYEDARRSVLRAVRREWDAAHRATLVEFTTGLGTGARGQRRPHWNDMWKGIPDADADDLLGVLTAAWCKHVDAAPAGQYVGTIGEAGGLMRYLALHFQKESQQPPQGWRSHRFTTTRGYLAEPMDSARARARDALRLRRELWKLSQEVVDTDRGPELLVDLVDAHEIDAMAERAHEARSDLEWQLVREAQVPTDFSDEGDPIAWASMTFPVR